MYQNLPRWFAFAGALSAFFAVALGAFAAHALKKQLAPDLLAVWETGVRYQAMHALALFAAAWAATQWPGRLVAAVGALFVLGTLLFSGSLYLLVLSGVRGLGAVTPLGGVCFLAAWLLLAAVAWRGSR